MQLGEGESENLNQDKKKNCQKNYRKDTETLYNSHITNFKMITKTCLKTTDI